MSAPCRQSHSWECFCFSVVSLSACSFPWGIHWCTPLCCLHANEDSKITLWYQCVRERILQPARCYSHLEPNVIMFPRLCWNSDSAAEIILFFLQQRRKWLYRNQCLFLTLAAPMSLEKHSEWESEQQRGFWRSERLCRVASRTVLPGWKHERRDSECFQWGYCLSSSLEVSAQEATWDKTQ